MNLTLAGDVTKVRVRWLQETAESFGLGLRGRPIRRNPRSAKTFACSQEKIAAVELVHLVVWSKVPGLADCRMKPIPRQEQLTDASDSNDSSLLARRRWLFAMCGGAGVRCRPIGEVSSISRKCGRFETLLETYGYVYGCNRNWQQMAARQNCWRSGCHGRQSQFPDISWIGCEFHRGGFLCRR